jgi:hypothetical protein
MVHIGVSTPVSTQPSIFQSTIKWYIQIFCSIHQQLLEQLANLQSIVHTIKLTKATEISYFPRNQSVSRLKTHLSKHYHYLTNICKIITAIQSDGCVMSSNNLIATNITTAWFWKRINDVQDGSFRTTSAIQQWQNCKNTTHWQYESGAQPFTLICSEGLMLHVLTHNIMSDILTNATPAPMISLKKLNKLADSSYKIQCSILE